MKRVTFINSLTNKLPALFLMTVVVIFSRLIGQFLMSYYCNDPAHKYLNLIFRPININIWWGMGLLIGGFVMLIYVEYFFKSIAEDYK